MKYECYNSENDLTDYDQTKNPTYLKVITEDDGWWKDDQIKGKHLVKISLRHKHSQISLYHTPTHDFCSRHIKCMLLAEKSNDEFVFEYPKPGVKYAIIDGKYHRPPQLRNKINQIKSAIKEFEKWLSNQEKEKMTKPTEWFK